MDPNATLIDALNGDTEAARNLNKWIRDGGFKPRAQAHPATDAFMSGDRYGYVTSIRRNVVTMEMDVSGRFRRFTLDNVLPINY